MCFLWVGTEYLHNIDMICTFQRWKVEGRVVSRRRRLKERLTEWLDVVSLDFFSGITSLTIDSLLSEFFIWPWRYEDSLSYSHTDFFTFFSWGKGRMASCFFTRYSTALVLGKAFYLSKPSIKLINRNAICLWYFVLHSPCSAFFCFVSYLTENTLSLWRSILV